MIQFILGYGHSEFTRTCIRSIYENTPEEQINLVVWENRSGETLRPEDVDPRNTVVLSMDLNYGCSTALNALIKEFGARLEMDVIYISNDHFVFPHWITPLLKNPRGYHVISPMHPYGLTSLHARLLQILDFKEERKREYLDHPESAARIREFLHLIYGDDLNRFVIDAVSSMPEIAVTEEFWAGCFYLRKDILGDVGLFRTDRGLACDEDVLWVQDNILGKYQIGVYSHCYMHHFQSITTNRFHLSMDHAPDEFSRRGSVPPMTDQAWSTLAAGVERMKVILSRGHRGYALPHSRSR